ncbi:L-fucose dehydrogenase-like [Babylonia areolata]|uniref:L-fucose dehydrogenase-like n=1 Tax=Babylonia areolata TaxID=304850 RepID=UPI003FD13A46
MASSAAATSAGLRYKDKVTIVTGGSKGIGKGCVEVFVKNGSKVVFCARGEKEGAEVEAAMNAMGPGEATFVKCDMSQEDQIKNLIDVTVAKYGRIDCLINNAGIHPPHKPIDDFTTDDVRELMNINFVSYFAASKYALPHLRKTQGNIINDGSLVAHLGQMWAVSYVATKGAIASMTRALAVDEAAHNVRVNMFSPGNVWTPLWEDAAKTTGDFETAIQGGRDCQLLGRFGTIEECGLVCMFLAADATFCTGIDIPVSGGAELNYGNKNMQGKENPFK